MSRHYQSLMALWVAGGLAVAAAGAWAQGGPGSMPCAGGAADCPAHGPGMGRGGAGHGPMKGGMHEQAGWGAARLTEVKQALKLQPEQMTAWNAYEARVIAQRDAQTQRFEQMRTLRGNPDALAEFRVKALAADAQAAEEINTARKALVAVLTPAQKTAFAQTAGPQREAARLAQMKDALKLQPGQMAAWDAFEGQVKAQRERRAAAMGQMAAVRNDPEALADFRVQQMKLRAQSAAEIYKARQALVATLTPEQKAAFDRLQPGFGAPGPGGHRHGHGGMDRG